MSAHRDLIACLLGDGRSTLSPTAALLDAAEHLRGLDLIGFQVREFVRCADPLNLDRHSHNRVCRGRIYLDDHLDDAGHDFRCPACDRVVFPHRLGMNRIRELRSAVRLDGVVAYVRSRLAEADEIGRGHFRVESADDGELDVVVHARATPTLWPTNRRVFVIDVHECSAGPIPPNVQLVGRTCMADVLTGEMPLSGRVKQALTRQAVALQPTEVTPASPARSVTRDGFRFGGQNHQCSLTPQDVEVLRGLLPNEKTECKALMFEGDGAVWHERYSGTKRQRGAISAALLRLNKALKASQPRSKLEFRLPRNQHHVQRVTARLHVDD